VKATSFTANWNSLGVAAGYRLDVATDPGFVNYVPGYQNLDVGNVTNRNVSGLTPNTNYYYRVRAYNGNGTSPNSNVIKVKTKPH
jgi:phosphodiesterase/alkaline phosphatase D-like protein